MSSNLEEQILSELLDELEKDQLVLPTLPEVALRIRESIEDDNSSTASITKVIGTDAALTAKLLQIANSALLRANREIETLDAAINRMGRKMLRNVVNSIIVQQMFQATTDVTDKRLRALWEHSAQVAAISHALARFAKLQPDEALLAGLIHDVGALPILTKAEDVPELLKDVEMLDRIINKLHSRIGAAILKKWNFPEELIAVAAEHENLLRDTGSHADYVDVVIAANLQSYMGTNHPHANMDWSDVPAFNKLGLSPEISVIEMDEVGEDIKEVQQALLS